MATMFDTYRFASRDRTARATYRPDLSESAPWVTYINGTAGRHFESAEEAGAYLGSRGFHPTTSSVAEEA